MIRLNSVERYFDNGAVKAIDNVTLEIGTGEKVALEGPSGAGKSTLLNMIGLIDTPSAGEISIDDKKLSEVRNKSAFRARNIGIIYQFHYLLPHLTAVENVETPLFATGTSRGERRRRALGLLESVGIDHKRDQLPGRLSGGERQRVAVARALANEPSILLADEPTGSLDEKTGGQVIDLLSDYCDARQATLLLATHNRAVVERMDRSIAIHFGRIQ